MDLDYLFIEDIFFAFKSEVTQGIAQVLGIDFNWHCVWHSQSSGKVERTSGLLKRHIHKLSQEVQAPGWQLLPLVLIRLHNTHGKLGLCPSENLYGQPFLTNDIVLDQETQWMTECYPIISFPKSPKWAI